MTQINPSSTINITFKETELTIPNSVLELPIEKQKDIFDYLMQMSQSQKKAYTIAMHHLKTSFDILKSNGFMEWQKTK
jgi:hypothetical protein